MTAARLVRLYAVNRRVPFAVLAIAACAAGLRIALLGHWDAYGAVPLIFEVAAAVSVVATVASPFGEPERVAGRWLPYLRLAVTAALTAAAVGLLTAAGVSGQLSGGPQDVLRNVAGITGIGLLCAAALGGGLSWTAPTGYLVVAVYAPAVAPAGHDHPVAVAGPAAARPGRGDLRRAGVRRRARGHHCPRRPRTPKRLTWDGGDRPPPVRLGRVWRGRSG